MIVARTLTTPAGMVLNSKHRHDYNFIIEDGHAFMLDGGCFSGYYRSSGVEHGGIIKEYKLWDSIEEIREVFHWGKSTDQYGNILPHIEWVKLKDLGDDHLDALFNYSKLDWQKILWLKEKLYRAEQEYE